MDEPILVTGASGFIGTRVVRTLLEYGFRDVGCFVRSARGAGSLDSSASGFGNSVRVRIIKGNLLAPSDCLTAAKDAAVVYHLAAGTGEKSYPDAFMNSVVTTRNLLDACVREHAIKRFVSISSFAVYSNRDKKRGRVLDETAPIEERPQLRGEAYCYAKVRQDQLVEMFGTQYGIPYVLIRPGAVYGPERPDPGPCWQGSVRTVSTHGRAQPDSFTYVDNCAEAIVLAGFVKGVDGEVFNVVDDDLPTSRKFLRMYKQNVKSFHSISVPRFMSYLGCYLWESHSDWSQGQLAAVFNRLVWHAYWKGNIPVNDKIKNRLGWRQRVSTADGMKMLFQSRGRGQHA